MKVGCRRVILAGLVAGATGLGAARLASAGEGAFAGGSGTENDPYQIGNVQQLQAMKNSLSAHYVLVSDIDASATASWEGGKGFTPVGNPAAPFTGTFDGQGHTIDGLRIDRFGQVTTHIALFGITGEKAVIRDVHLRKAFSKGCDCVGILVGVNQGTISRCYVSGEVYGSGTFGGLVGGNNKGRIEHCGAAVNVGPVWVGNHLGGLVGSNNGGEIIDCYATGNVSGQENPGGLVGVNGGGVIRRCYATGNVSSSFGGASDSYRRGAGGLVAQNSGGGTISDCFATGTVSAPGGAPAGGLLGFNADQGVVSNSYYQAPQGVTVAGIGRNYPDAGSAECENAPEIGAAFFDAGKGPLRTWAAGKTWSAGAAGLPRFASSFGAEPASGGAAAEPPKRTVVAELVDGSVIVGKPGITELKVVSALGKINIPVAGIARVAVKADKETSEISLANGDRLTGVVDLAALEVQTAWGTVSLPMQHIRTLIVRGGRLSGSTPFDVAGAGK